MQQLNSGIYQIRNLVNGKIYIGSASNFKKRWYKHKVSFISKVHHNKHLQHAWNKYGEECFKFEILARCPPEYLIKMEQWFLDNLKPEYNICKVAGNTLGVIISDETRKKISIANTGRKQSEETKQKRAASLKGRKPSEYCLFKLRQANKGKTLSPEHIEILKKKMTGRIVSQETRLKLKNNQTGKKYSEQSKQKMSMAQKGNQNCLNRQLSLATKNKIRESRLKPVLQFSVDGVLIKEWKSRCYIVNELKYDPQRITDCCKGLLVTAYGYKWQYKK